MIGLGGWVGALIVGLLLVLLGPLAPEPVGYILRVIGIIVLVVAAILFLFWILGVLGVTAGAAAVLLA